MPTAEEMIDTAIHNYGCVLQVARTNFTSIWQLHAKLIFE